MAIDDQIRDEKVQYNINREAAKPWTLSSSKVDKYEFLTVLINMNFVQVMKCCYLIKVDS